MALAACSCVCFQTAVAAVTYPGTTPGAPSAHREEDVYTLRNNILSASWMVSLESGIEGGASYVKENYRIEASKEVDLKKMEEE